MPGTAAVPGSASAATTVSAVAAVPGPGVVAAAGAAGPGAAGVERRALGAYYTPGDAAGVLARWALRSGDERVLEPSFGDGSFLRAVRGAAAVRAGTPEVFGVELCGAVFARTLATGLLGPDRAHHGDFLAVAPFGVDAVIGNPPFVRIRHLPASQRQAALAAAAAVLPGGMDHSGSVWMPFVLHASRFLRPGGRLALVLPYEVTHVRYARPLWAFLGRSFAAVRVGRVFSRLFPELLQDVVLLFADGFGGRTDRIGYDIYRTVDDLARGVARTSTVYTAEPSSWLPIDDLVAGARGFVDALLPRDLQALLRGPLATVTAPASRQAEFRIGYVAGDKSFFHPGPEVVRRYRIPAASLRPTLTSTRALRGAGLHTSGVASVERLFLPGGALTDGEQEYLCCGRQLGVPDRYKCRIRTPWYRVPGVRTPDVVVSVFSSVPLLMLNDGVLTASNSLLCGQLAAGVDPAGLAGAWYTPLTLLECELKVHSLGGGVLVLIPGEVNKLRLLVPDALRRSNGATQPAGHRLDEVDRRLRSSSTVDAYLVGAEPLRRAAELSRAELDLIAAGHETLVRWRTRRPTPQ